MLLTCKIVSDIIRTNQVAKRNRKEYIVINSKKIKGRMRELDITQMDVAKALKIAQPTANQKINNIRPLNLDEAEILAELLKISDDEFGIYFFAS